MNSRFAFPTPSAKTQRQSCGKSAPFLDQAIAEFQNVEAPVEEVTNAQPSSESETNPNPLLPSFDPITEKQLKTLRDLLTKKGVPESDLCKAHGVSRLEDLKKGEGRWIISDLIYK